MIKNIILIGKTGSGKSTLANVISDTNEFKESSGSVSETREIKSKIFSFNEEEYQIIDTVGIGDTKLSSDEVLDKIAEAVYLAREGIHQIFFLFTERLDIQQVSIYNILKMIIFDEKSVNFTTIIRTNFPKFKDELEIKKDIEEMISSGGKVSEIVKECENRFVYVNNSDINISCDDCKKIKNFDDCFCEESININKKDRLFSRDKLFNLLKKIKGNYKPKKLKELSVEIVDLIIEKKKSEIELEEKLKKLKERRVEENSLKLKGISRNRSDLEKTKDIFLPTSPIRLIFEDKQIENFQNVIRDLRNKIEEKKREIRTKIFSHILNNYDEIANIDGSEYFFNQIGIDNRISEIDSNKNNFYKWLKDYENLSPEELLKKDKKSFDKIKEKFIHYLKNEIEELKIKNGDDDEYIDLYSLEKSEIYGGVGGENFDDLDLIKSKVSSKNVKKINISKIEVDYSNDVIISLSLTYEVITDEGNIIISDKEIKRNFKRSGESFFEYSFPSDEKINEIVIYTYFWELKVINGLEFKTSKEKILSFGEVEHCKSFKLKVGDNLVIYGNSGDLMDGLGFYSNSTMLLLDDSDDKYIFENDMLSFNDKYYKTNEISLLNYELEYLKNSLLSKLKSNHLIPKERKKRNEERKKVVEELFSNLDCEESKKSLLIDKLYSLTHYKKSKSYVENIVDESILVKSKIIKLEKEVGKLENNDYQYSLNSEESDNEFFKNYSK